MSKPRYYLNALGMINALGNDLAVIARRLAEGDTSGMVTEPVSDALGSLPVGRVSQVLPAPPAALARDDCRNNRLLLAALATIEVELEKVLSRYSRSRIGVVLGTTTSGIVAGEAMLAEWAAGRAAPAGYDYQQVEIGAAAPFLAKVLGVTGPAYTISTACTSSAKVFAVARRLLQAGLCDAVVLGGADTLSGLTLGGFSALESISPQRANPMSRNRRGINLGEGAALFIMSRDEAPIALLGVGEASDAYHISAPDPQGKGAEMALRAALDDAALTPSQMGYVNLHATATPKNDEMESRVMQRVFPAGVPTSGTKPLVGHLLGAAGATELGFCWLLLNGMAPSLPPHIWDGEADPQLPRLDLVQLGQSLRQQTCMSNSFAFGGSNVSLIIGG